MQIHNPTLLERQEIPSSDTMVNRQDYDGPRTTSATTAVAKHVRSFYRLFGTIGIFLAVSIFGIFTIAFGYINRTLCPDADNAPHIIVGLGSLVLIICGISIIIVCISMFYLIVIDSQNSIFRAGKYSSLSI